MTSSVATALASAMRAMPAPAMPGVIDALLLVTGASASAVHRDLLEILPLEEIACDGNIFEAVKASMLHLLRLSDDMDILDQIVHAVCLPLLVSDSSKGSRFLAEAIATKCSWDFALARLIPSCSKALAAAVDCRDTSDRSDDVLSLAAACQLLSQLLLLTNNDDSDKFRSFCVNILDRSWNPALRLLSESLDDALRSLIMQTLMPALLRASRLTQPARKLEDLWNCCKILLSSNESQRRDAYRILSMLDDFGDLFLNDALFWEELRAGLVDADPLTRKRALHILKQSLKSVEISTEADSADAVPVEAAQKIASKRERWANEEAKSLGVQILSAEMALTNEIQRWRSFLLLYETLEEYGIHLVEAAWEKQIIALVDSVCIEKQNSPGELNLSWILLLFDRGFRHKNPQVRRYVFRSFFQIKWGSNTKIPENFLLGPLLYAMNDPVHHKDFGANGSYTSDAGKSSMEFFRVYTASMNLNARVFLITSFVKAITREALCRAGLMTFASCVEAIATTEYAADSLGNTDESLQLLDSLRSLAESSRHHFNPRYRAEVCSHLLKSLSSLYSIEELKYDNLSFFLAGFPREFFAPAGPLRSIFDYWLNRSGEKGNQTVYSGLQAQIFGFLKSPECDQSYSITEEDIESWRETAERWIRLLFIGVHIERHQSKLLLLLEQYAVDIYERVYMPVTVPEKILLLLQSLVTEWEIFGRTASSNLRNRVSNLFQNTMGGLISYTEKSVARLWESDIDIDTSVHCQNGRLGGPSLRRLPPRAAIIVIRAVLAVETLVECSVWRFKNESEDPQESAGTFLWKISWKLLGIYDLHETLRGEFQLARLEAMASICKALSFVNNTARIRTAIGENTAEGCSSDTEPALFVDNLATKLLKLFNDTKSRLARSRCAVLNRHKWSCLGGFLSLSNAGSSDVSKQTLSTILEDALESMGSATEDYMVPIFRCMRWLLNWDVLDFQDDPIQVVWELVRSGWTCIGDSKKRTVALFSVFLSSLFHPKLFSMFEMHITNEDDEGPLKWLLGRLIELGSRSPRTIRLTSLHLTGLWLKYPETTRFYMPEIKLLCLYGSEAIDEEFDGEISASTEFAALIQSSDPELQEAFSNSEMFARVAIAIMMDKFARLVETEPTNSYDLKVSVPAALHCGQSLLLQLLSSAVHDTDLSKELYKKNSAIHRRKVRLWQMLCILTRFINESMLENVLSLMEQCLYKNNMPSVRQYIETFSVQLYVRFPALVNKHLVPLVSDVNLKTQALSSYVYIAANVLKFISPEQKEAALQQLLPVVLPHMTSHHHNLRTFTQVLVFHVFRDYRNDPILTEKLGMDCLTNISSYLENNSDCTRLRESVNQFVFKLEPSAASKPRGIFCGAGHDSTKMLEERPFECVPVSAVDKIAEILNVSREALRETMSADALYLNYGDDKAGERVDNNRGDYQMKVVPYKDMTEDGEARVTDMEYEDNLLFSMIDKKGRELAKEYEGRQDLIVVASLVERIPNLAGLARTCEVFKAAALVIPDKKILEDRQFKMISVTADQWIPIVEVADTALVRYLERKKSEGYAVLGLEQTANSITVNNYSFPSKVILVLGREKDGVPANIIQILDACLEIPQLGMIRSLNVHISGAIAVWEYTKQQYLKGDAV